MEQTQEDEIKEAFQRVKEDIGFLNHEVLTLKEDLKAIKDEMVKICEILKYFTLETPKKHVPPYPTDRQINLTLPPQNPTQNMILEPLKAQNKLFSTGNEGVPTDRQTDRQTDNTSQKHLERSFFPKNEPSGNSIEDAARMLDSLDDLKKEIRLKFKQLTDQEILVFSTLYQLEEDIGSVDYKTLAEKLGLTESSIRDYVGRLLKKGIPVEKEKINNKQIRLSISQSLKKIASLSTILQLRDI